MAQKRSLLDSIPPVSSEEEDEESTDASEDEKEQVPKSKAVSAEDDDESGEESEESDDEEEEEKTKPVPVTPPVQKKPSLKKHEAAPAPTTPQSSSESDAEDGAGSDSDSGDTQQSPTASAFTIKPIISKTTNDSSDPKKQAPKSAGRSSSTPSKSTAKRPAETQQNGKDSRAKKSKVSNKDEEDGKTEEKKSSATRLWTEKDEIAILNGMISYKSEKGSDPLSDLVAFHDFIKDSIRADVSKNQLSDKIRRLKKKYQTNAEKGENGEDPVLARPHEYKTFDLSKKIWGSSSTITNAVDDNNGTSNNSTARKSRKTDPKGESKAIAAVAELKAEQVKDDSMADGKDFSSVYPRLNEMFNLQSCFSEDSKRFFQTNFRLIGPSKAKEMDDKWKNLQMEEFEVYSKRMALISEQSKLVLDAVKSSRN